MVLGQADWQKVMNAIGVLRPAGSHNDFFAAVIRLGTFDFLALTNGVCAFLHFLEVEGLLEVEAALSNSGSGLGCFLMHRQCSPLWEVTI
jgi:hypothetical protein